MQNSTETAPRRSRWWQNRGVVDLCCIALLIAVCLGIGLPRYRLDMDWADEGFLAYGAVRVGEGQVVNRDFVSLQPPLSFYVVAGVFKVLGPSLLAMRALGLVMHLLIVLLVYGIARCFLTPMFSAAAALPAAFLGMPFFYFSPFPVMQGVTASLLAAFFYLRAMLGRRVWMAVAAGVLTSVSLALRHEQAVYFVLSLLVFTIAIRQAKNSPVAPEHWRKCFLWWMIGAVVTGVAAVILWLAQGALPEMFRQLVLFPFTTYRRTSAKPFPHFDPRATLADNASVPLFYAAPLLVALAMIWLIWRIARNGFGRGEAVGAFLITWSLLFYCQVLTRSDMHHLVVTLSPCFILAAYCWERVVAATRSKVFQTLLLLGPAAVFATYIWIISPLIMADLSKTYVPLELKRGGIRVENGDWFTNFVRGVQDYVPPDRSILAVPYQPMFYFLCERRNPTRWNYLWPGDQTAQDHAALVEQAKSDPPAVILITDESALTGFAPTIMDYVHDQYEHRGDFVQMSVYFPKP